MITAYTGIITQSHNTDNDFNWTIAWHALIHMQIPIVLLLRTQRLRTSFRSNVAIGTISWHFEHVVVHMNVVILMKGIWEWGKVFKFLDA